MNRKIIKMIVMECIIVFGSLIALFAGVTLEILLLPLLFLLCVTVWKYLKRTGGEA